MDLKDNKIFWGLIALTIFNLTLLFGSKFIIDKVADRVIQKLQKEYSPSPYGPGFDPDKINIDFFKKSIVAATANTQISSAKITNLDEEWEAERANPGQ